jgi:hypothetical protein
LLQTAHARQGDVVHVIRFAVVSLGLLVLAACSFRHRLAIPYPAALPVDQRVEIWRKDDRIVLNHVTIDSVAFRGDAVPWRPRCDSCHVAIPRAEVDSAVLVNHELGWMLGGTAVLVTVWILNHCWPAVGCVD